jgi:hypothetical protein
LAPWRRDAAALAETRDLLLPRLISGEVSVEGLPLYLQVTRLIYPRWCGKAMSIGCGQIPYKRLVDPLLADDRSPISGWINPL